MYRIFVLVIALIVYGSLYPWDFHSAHLAANPFWVLLHSWPANVDRSLLIGLAVNVFIFVPVGVFGFFALRQNFRTPVAVSLTILFALLLSSSIEIAQLFDDGRECTASDVVFNVSGTGIGAVLGYLHHQWLKRFLARAETSRFLHPSGAVLLFYTWLGYQAFPFFPMLSRTRFHEKLHRLFATMSVSPVEAFTHFVGWLIVARLLESALGTERARRWFPLLLLVLPAKLLIVGNTITWSELAGALFAYISWYLSRGFTGRTAGLSGLTLLMLIVRGLAPYHWTSVVNPFSWVPFSGLLAGEPFFGLQTLLQKCFQYGSAVWLLRAAGLRIARAAVAVAMLLGAIEIIQTHLPGHVAEITDPLLGLILAATLGALDRSQNAGNAPPASPVPLRN